MAIKFTSEEDFAGSSNEILRKIVLSEDITIRYKLKELLEERRLINSDLAKMTGIRNGTLTDYVNNKQNNRVINISHLFAMMIALRVSHIEDIIEVELPLEKVRQYKQESNDWIKYGIEPAIWIEERARQREKKILARKTKKKEQ
ncbi:MULTISPECIES: helix-turn-helix domain-containing protein [unclassified Enterococcus]|jgi:putative transcriptional regulator|uniref:helix-turn-helix domain-containing protein n=1 Tax=unclassified Enterococcus TaxID=2608891 RepID=UPI003D2D0D31